MDTASNSDEEEQESQHNLFSDSLIECDQDFGVIEKAKNRNHQQGYLPSKWADIIVKSSRKFMVTQMENNDIVSLDSLEPYFKKNVGISKMQCMHFEKAHPYTLFYKQSINIPNFHELNMKSLRAGRPLNELPLLAATGDMPKIKKLKFDNLQSLLPYVPPIYHDFFNTLQYINGPNNVPVEVNQDATVPLGDEEPENIFDSDSED